MEQADGVGRQQRHMAEEESAGSCRRRQVPPDADSEGRWQKHTTEADKGR